MKLVELRIKNFKSLADVRFRPSDLSVIVGPNGAGKSNFAQALQFLGDVFDRGLEPAIREQGGYENIIRWEKMMVQEAIEFELEIECSRREFRLTYEKAFGDIIDLNKSPSEEIIRIQYHFSFSSPSSNFDFHISSESCWIGWKGNPQQLNFSEIISWKRESNQISDYHFDASRDDIVVPYKPGFVEEKLQSNYQFSPQQLIIEYDFPWDLNFFEIKQYLRQWRVFMFSPSNSRNSGSPTPNPELDPNGENLPSIVQWLVSSHPEKWDWVLNNMMTVVPTLEDISAENTLRQLVLFFHERGIGRPWIAGEISDGTIMALSILCALADPRNKLILIEEPENSLHPWIIHHIMKSFRSASEEKRIILTTHSPLIINALLPTEIFVVSKPGVSSHLDLLTELDQEIQREWEAGKVHLADFLESGWIGQAVPGGI